MVMLWSVTTVKSNMKKIEIKDWQSKGKASKQNYYL